MNIPPYIAKKTRNNVFTTSFIYEANVKMPMSYYDKCVTTVMKR